MRQSSWTPSIVPGGKDETVYIVLDDFGELGRSYLEVDEKLADLETIITGMLEGQYSNPASVFAFNAAEGWARDVSQDVAAELRRRCDLQMTEVPASLRAFIERHENRDSRQLGLRLI